MPTKLPFVLGFDFSGVVSKVGSSVKSIKEGDEVFGRSPNMGAYAEYVAVPETKATKKPK